MDGKSKLSRRKFLIGGASLIGATALTGVSGMGMAMRQPEVKFNSLSYGGSGDKNGKILVAYASQAGSTGEMARVIGQVICKTGTAVDMCPIKTVNDLTNYRAVVIGSAIHRSAWMPEAVEFIKTHKDTLSRIPIAYFLSCLTLTAPNTNEVRRKVASFLDPVRQEVPEVKPIDVGLFAGKLDFNKLPYAYRLIWPFTSGGQVTEGDYRDWKTIKAWADNLSPMLLNA